MRALAVPVLVLVALAAPARADEEKVPLDKAPTAVVEAAKKRFPKAEVVGVSKETENGKTVYEVELKQGGKTTDVTLTPEGVITLIEQQIDAKDLPKAVSGALEQKYPKAAYKLVEAVYAVKGGKESIDFYELLLATTDKKELEVQVLPDGKIKNEEEKKAGAKDEKKPVLYRDDEGKGQKGKKGEDESDEKGKKGKKAKKGEDDEDDVEFPKAVAGAVREKFPGGKVVGASKEGKGQKAVYEVELRYKSATLEVVLTATGDVVEVEVKGQKKEEEAKGEKKGDEGGGKKGKKKGEDDEEGKGKKAQGKKSGSQGEQKGQHEDEKKGEGKQKGEKDRD
jgi:hypothetical protein